MGLSIPEIAGRLQSRCGNCGERWEVITDHDHIERRYTFTLLHYGEPMCEYSIDDRTIWSLDMADQWIRESLLDASTSACTVMEEPPPMEELLAKLPHVP
jgi:hypothetical protein